MRNPFINWISDLLWPHRCLGCGVQGVSLCAACVRAIPLRPFVMTVAGGVSVISGNSLSEPLLSKAVWHLKYRNMPLLAPPLAGWLANVLGQMPQSDLQSAPLLVPVPLHRRKIQERGYNQAELVAECLEKITGLTGATDIVSRIRNTPSQVTSIGRNARIANMAGAFRCLKPQRVRGQSILLVDDVCTTGATLAECAITLKAAGAHAVAAVVLARA